MRLFSVMLLVIFMLELLSCFKATTTYMVFKDEKEKVEWKKRNPNAKILFEDKNIIKIKENK